MCDCYRIAVQYQIFADHILFVSYSILTVWRFLFLLNSLIIIDMGRSYKIQAVKLKYH